MPGLIRASGSATASHGAIGSTTHHRNALLSASG